MDGYRNIQEVIMENPNKYFLTLYNHGTYHHHTHWTFSSLNDAIKIGERFTKTHGEYPVECTNEQASMFGYVSAKVTNLDMNNQETFWFSGWYTQKKEGYGLCLSLKHNRKPQDWVYVW